MKPRPALLLMLLFPLFFSLTTSANDHPKSSAGQREPGFIQNKGQVINQNRQPQPDVLFIYAAGSFKWILRTDGFSYELATVISDANKTEDGASQIHWDDIEEGITDVAEHIEVNTVDVKFVNANKKIEVEYTQPVSYYYNYCTSDNPHYFVHLYKDILYHNVYNGIDLNFSFLQDEKGQYHPEYKWIIHKNGNVKDISLTYEGANEIYVKEDGSLFIGKDIGFISEKKPEIIFDDGSRSSEINFALSGNHLSFAGKKTGTSKGFVIDPTLVWGIYYGGNKDDFPNEIAISATNGNDSIYICGFTQSVNYIVTDPNHPDDCPEAQDAGYKLWDHEISGARDAILAKFDANMNFQWATYYGGADDEKAFAIAVDPLGPYVVIAGRTFSADAIDAGQDPATGNANHAPVNFDFYHSPDSLGDGFLAKFNSKGWLIRGLYVGGDRNDYFLGVTFDRLGNIYASGASYSSPSVHNANVVLGNPEHGVEQTECYVNGDQGDVLLVKFKNDLSSKIWGTYLGDAGGKGNERGHNLTVDYNFNIYQVGTVSGDDRSLPVAGHNDPNVFQPCKFDTTDKNKDAFLAKWDSSGKIIWFSYYGGDDGERGRGVKTDDAGNIYALGIIRTKCNPTCESSITSCGTTNFSGAYPTTGSNVVIKTQMDLNDSNDGFLAKFEPVHGGLIWNTYFGGSNVEMARTLAVNPKGTPIYIGGWTKSTHNDSIIPFPITVDAPQKNLGSNNDFFFAKLNWNATKTLYCTYYGGSEDEGKTSDGDWYQGTMDVNHTTGDIYITSFTNSSDSIVKGSPTDCFESLKTNNPGTTDFFIAKFSDDCSDTYREPYAGDAFDPNESTSDAPSLIFTRAFPVMPPWNQIKVNGKLYPLGDQDFYSFIAPSNTTKFRIGLTVPSGKDYDLKFYPCSSCTPICGCTSGNETITTPKTTVGSTYYVSVSASSNANPEDSSSISCYTLTIAPLVRRDFFDDAIPNAAIYPSPAQSETNLSVSSVSGGWYKIGVYNLMGIEILSEDYYLETGENTIKLQTENLSSGYYMIKIESDNQQQVLKLEVIN